MTEDSADVGSSYANANAHRIDAVLWLWSQLTGLPATHRTKEGLKCLPNVSTLTDADDQTLTEAARPLLDKPHSGLAFVDWADATSALQIRDHPRSYAGE